MHRVFFPCLLFVFAIPAAAQPQSLGVFANWGAFRSDQGCHAVSRPVERTNRGQAFAAVAYWPERRIRGQLHVRLSEPKRDGSAILLKIDGRTYQLRGSGVDAWAPDKSADAEIRAALRTGMDMAVETRAVNGQRIRQLYRLRGAATAMDSAAVACAR